MYLFYLFLPGRQVLPKVGQRLHESSKRWNDEYKKITCLERFPINAWRAGGGGTCLVTSKSPSRLLICSVSRGYIIFKKIKIKMNLGGLLISRTKNESYFKVRCYTQGGPKRSVQSNICWEKYKAHGKKSTVFF